MYEPSDMFVVCAIHNQLTSVDDTGQHVERCAERLRHVLVVSGTTNRVD